MDAERGRPEKGSTNVVDVEVVMEVRVVGAPVAEVKGNRFGPAEETGSGGKSLSRLAWNAARSSAS